MGEAAEAADAYAAAVKAHCDAEAVHAKAVENIGHGHLKQDKCAKPVPEVTALKARPVSRARAGLEDLAALSTATPPSRTVQAHARTPQTAASRGGNWTSAHRRRW